MSRVDNFEDWNLPVWHDDFGDSRLEFGLLKSFCVEAKKHFPHLNFVFDAFEEGHMCVQISSQDVKFAELHVTDIDTWRLTFFNLLDERNAPDEQSFQKPQYGMETLKKFVDYLQSN